MARRHHAREALTADEALALLPGVEAHTAKILARVNRITPLAALKDRPAVLDIGAAQGLFLLCCGRRGCRAVGIEPWAEARSAAEQIARRQGVDISILPGMAEQLPFGDGEFDFVHANSVLEHVADARAVFGEAHRVLKPGGLFWFATASSLCPRQHEIARFPLFGWYPDRLKQRIMQWARARRPELIGGTEFPAINWFTPGKAKRMLAAAGFARVYDRWEFRLPEEGGRMYRAALAVIRAFPPAKFLADVLIEGCNFAAVK
jgi:SAM-dependent methyltransferase